MNRDMVLTPELVLSLQDEWEALKAIDLTKLAEEKEARKTKIERIIEDVSLGKKLERRVGKKREVKIGRPKLHWKTREANRKATKRKYYENTWKPRRQAETIELLQTAEGWYEHVTKYWKGERFGLIQWKRYLWPRLEGKVPVFKREDTKKGWTLDNVVMYESGTRNMLYCPEDLKLLKLGAISEI
jgi:hypothetical protein